MKKLSTLRFEKQYSVDNQIKSGMRMRLFLWLLPSLCLAYVAAGRDAEVIASFEKPNSTKNWVAVNDGVMGGLSKGYIEQTKNKKLLFSGDISLKNNGGFSSIRTKPSAMNLAGASGIIVKARGDGRTYWFGLRTKSQFGASSYRAYLPTSKGELIETLIPLANFKLQAFGRKLSGRPIDPAAIVSVGFTLADKKAGPFKLEIESIKAVFKEAKPPANASAGTLVDIAAAAGTFKTLLAAVDAADLTAALKGKGPLTLFAPTDKAFAQLPSSTVDNLLKLENKQQLAEILKYHVVTGRITLAKALEARECITLQGGKLSATFKDGSVRIGPASLIQTDIIASNGIIHVIDQVLLPNEPTADPLTPVALIELAIERGVTFFNNGEPRACAAIYEVTCQALRIMPNISEASHIRLGQALAKMRTEKTASQKAWILRYALDRVLFVGTEGE